MSSFNPVQTQIINSFRSVNVADLPFRLKSDEVAFSINMDFLDDGTMQQRPGSALVSEIGTDVQLFTFSEIRNGVVADHLIALGGDKAYRFNGASFDVIASGMTSSVRWGGGGFIGTFLFSNGTELKSFKFDTSTSAYIVADVTGDAIPKALLWSEFQGRLWACKDGTENLMWSNIGDPMTWDATNFIALGAMPTSIKATGEFLFIGTDRGLFKIAPTGDADVPFAMTSLINIGVVPNTMQEISAGVLSCWLINGEYIVFNQYAQTGSQINTKNGSPIKNAVTASSLDSDVICSFVDRKSGKTIYSAHVAFPVESVSGVFPASPGNNIQFVLNNNTLGWTFYNMCIRSIAEFNGEVYFSDFSGCVHKFSASLFRDNGADFISRVITPIYDMGRGEMQKGFRKLWLSANSKSKTNINVSFAVNYSLLATYEQDNPFYAYGGIWGSSKWGEFIWGGILNQLTSVDLDVYGTGIQFIFDKQFDDADMQIKGFSFTYLPSYQEEF